MFPSNEKGSQPPKPGAMQDEKEEADKKRDEEKRNKSFSPQPPKTGPPAVHPPMPVSVDKAGHLITIPKTLSQLFKEYTSYQKTAVTTPNTKNDTTEATITNDHDMHNGNLTAKQQWLKTEGSLYYHALIQEVGADLRKNNSFVQLLDTLDDIEEKKRKLAIERDYQMRYNAAMNEKNGIKKAGKLQKKSALSLAQPEVAWKQFCRKNGLDAEKGNILIEEEKEGSNMPKESILAHENNVQLGTDDLKTLAGRQAYKAPKFKTPLACLNELRNNWEKREKGRWYLTTWCEFWTHEVWGNTNISPDQDEPKVIDNTQFQDHCLRQKADGVDDHCTDTGEWGRHRFCDETNNKEKIPQFVTNARLTAKGLTFAKKQMIIKASQQLFGEYVLISRKNYNLYTCTYLNKEGSFLAHITPDFIMTIFSQRPNLQNTPPEIIQRISRQLKGCSMLLRTKYGEGLEKLNFKKTLNAQSIAVIQGLMKAGAGLQGKELVEHQNGRKKEALDKFDQKRDTERSEVEKVESQLQEDMLMSKAYSDTTVELMKKYTSWANRKAKRKDKISEAKKNLDKLLKKFSVIKQKSEQQELDAEERNKANKFKDENEKKDNENMLGEAKKLKSETADRLQNLNTFKEILNRYQKDSASFVAEIDKKQLHNVMIEITKLSRTAQDVAEIELTSFLKKRKGAPIIDEEMGDSRKQKDLGGHLGGN